MTRCVRFFPGPGQVQCRLHDHHDGPCERPIELRPILIQEHVPAADGHTYQVFVDIDDVALRRMVPLVVGQHSAPSLLMLEAFKLRLVQHQ